MIRRRCFLTFIGRHRQHKKDNCEIQEDVRRKVLKGTERNKNIESQVRFYTIRAQTQRRSIMTPLYG